MTLAQRRAARESVAQPGQFEGQSPMVPILNDLNLDGAEDDSVSFGGDGYVDYYYQLGRWVVHVGDQGFISGSRKGSRAEADAVMANLHAEAERQEEMHS